jgi:hypothetical protein
MHNRGDHALRKLSEKCYAVLLMMDKYERGWMLMIIGFGVLLVALITAIGIHEYHVHRQCTDNGGYIEKYNCTTIYISVSCGSGCAVMTPEENCDERCVGANAEKSFP